MLNQEMFQQLSVLLTSISQVSHFSAQLAIFQEKYAGNFPLKSNKSFLSISFAHFTQFAIKCYGVTFCSVINSRLHALSLTSATSQL